MERLIHEKISRLKLEAVAVLVLVLLTACGDEDAGPPRADVQETVRTERPDPPTPPAEEPGLTSTPVREPVPSASPTPPAAETGLTSTPVREPVPSASPTPPAAETGPTSSRVEKPVVSASPTPSASPAVVADRPASASPEVALAEDRQLVRVRRGELVTSLSINGSIAFPNTRTVIFETQGTLGRLAVEEGQTVTAGQPLAYMDRATVIALEGAFAQAQVDASMAKEALANTLTPHSPLEIAQAEAKVANAKDTLRTAEQKLLSLLQPTDHELATAESVRADTILKIDTLRDEIDSLIDGPEEKEVEHLQFQARLDQIVLENALRGRSLTLEEWGAKIGAAYGEVEEATEEYRVFFLRWLGVDAHDVDASLPPDALLKLWGTDLESLYDRSQDASRLVPSFPDNDPSTAWNEQTIWAFTHLVPFEVRVSCEGSGSTPDVYCLSDEMIKAWDRLVVFRTKLDDLNTPADIALATADNTVDKARDSAALTAEQLADLLSPADPLLLRSKEKELALAETSLAEIEALFAGLQERLELGLALELPTDAPGTGEGIDTTVLDDVSESLRRELLSAQKEIEDTLLDLRVAVESLGALTGPSDPVLVALREAQLATAELEVGAALQRLEGVTLTSPIAGVVMQISAQAGDHIDRGAVAMTVVDPTVVEVRGAVDETDVLNVQVGAPASVLLRALPGRSLTGTVSYVSPIASKKPGAVTYDVRIGVESTRRTELRSGLTAVAEVVLRSEPNVLLIPLQALREDLNRTMVLAWEEGAMVEKLITTGSSDGFWAVVESGLSEGDVIVMEGIVGAPESEYGDLRPLRVGESRK